MARRKLLLADDSITIQKVVSLTFVDEGIDVISVGDGNTAVDRAFEELPDLVMADINMPGLSGYEVCERIRTDEKTRNIPVILLTGAFEKFDEAEAHRVGASAHLSKPFQSIRQLINQVSDLMESNSAFEVSGLSDDFEAVESVIAGNEQEAETNPFDEPVRSQLETFRDDRIASIDHQQDVQIDPPEKSQEVVTLSGTEPDDIDILYRQSIGEEPIHPDSELPDLGVDDEMIETSYSVAQQEDDNIDLSLPLETGPLDHQHDEEAKASPKGEFEEVRSVSPYETTDLSIHNIPEAGGATEPSRPNETIRLDPAMVDEQMAEANRQFETIEQPPPPTVESPIGEETIRMGSRFDTHGSPSYEFDDIDLLDIPSETEVEISTPADTAARGGNRQVVTLSPDLIEMIAQRVVEKLSEKY